MQTLFKVRILNGNIIKIIAALAMLIDHIGLLFSPPHAEIWRGIGRISMPLFAFMIAEGCRYTKDKFRHFSLLFLLAVACQIVYAVVDGSIIYLSILVTFTLSVIAIYALRRFKECLFDPEKGIYDKALSALVFAATVAVLWFLCSIDEINGKYFYIDYGFWGCMLPVFASLFDFRGIKLPEKAEWLDNHYIKVAAFAIGLLLLCLYCETELVMWYAFISLVPLLLYNEQRGRVNMKYFFYVFYPAHLAVLYGIAMLL